MTVNDLIRRAMRSIGVLHHQENPSDDEAADALDTLNDMLNAWIYDGIDLEFVSDLTLTGTLPYPDDHVTAIRYNLAVELAPEYGVQVPQAVGLMADKAKRALMSRYVKPGLLSVDEALTPVYNPNLKEGYYKDFS